MDFDIRIALVASELGVNLGISLLLLRVKTLHKLLDIGHAVGGAVVLPARGHYMVVDVHGAGIEGACL